ncbi:hypothetical protein V6N12_030633 [Hibiscus sabdariffa]|uniref:F-box domain-containing protein n=1 Tax=Hibiscus sabdariffa TaxID=183260 RepID=A0ABR1Z5R6_9ROSI
MAKSVKGVVQINDLPDSVLIHILSFLSTKDAARTSILSTRWRNLFTLVPNLNFDLDEKCPFWGWGRGDCKAPIKSFRCFVDGVLFFHDTENVDKFRLKFCRKRSESVDSISACRWISCALKRGVKHLDLNISLNKFTLPDALFTCRTLVTLKLDISLVFKIPEDIHFPNLQTLHLRSVIFFDDNSVKSLFSSCSNLEDVVIEKCSMTNVRSFSISHLFLKRLSIIHSCDNFKCWLMIDTPHLSNFKLIDNVVAGYSLKNLESIVSVDIQIQLEDEDLRADTRHATSIFREIYLARSLVMSAYSLELLLSCEPLPAFPTLVELEVPYNKAEQLNLGDKGLETLLPLLPELQNLAFRQDVLNSLPEEVPSCLLFKVKVIEISNFVYDQDCIRKAKYILENAATIRLQALNSLVRLSESVFSLLTDFKSTIHKDSSKAMIPGDGLHPLTTYSMNYLTLLADYDNILTDIISDWPPSAPARSSLPKEFFDSRDFNESPVAISVRIAWLILVLCKLDCKSKHYKDVSLSYLFLASNLQHIISRVRTSSLVHLLDEEWLAKHEAKVRQFTTNYEQLAWGKVFDSLPENPTAGMTEREAKECFKKFNTSFEDAYLKLH